MMDSILRTVNELTGQMTYVLEIKDVKHINLRITRDGVVHVSANAAVSIDSIDAFVQSKASYILRSQEHFALLMKNQQVERKYISGESFNILGRSVRLKVEKASKENVHDDGVYLYLNVKDPMNIEHKKSLVTRYLQSLCKNVFGEILRDTYPPFQKYGVTFPALRIREMDTRWGSCLAPKGIITLNKRLLEVPRSCIEYVVAHELCHCVHANHSRQFYIFMTMFMPDWQERKQQLDKYADYWL